MSEKNNEFEFFPLSKNHRNLDFCYCAYKKLNVSACVNLSIYARSSFVKTFFAA